MSCEHGRDAGGPGRDRDAAGRRALHGRAARGARQAGACGCASQRPRRLGAAAAPARPGRPARGAGPDARARPRADPLRPDARLGVHVLPRRRLPDGLRSRGDAAHRAAHAALRRRATSPTSASSPRPTGRSSSASTTSDETLPGPFEWDVKRLVASFAVAGRDRGFGEALREQINLEVTRSYRESMQQAAVTNNLALWYTRIDAEPVVERWRAQASAKDLKRLEKNVAKTRAKDSMKAFDKLTVIVDGEPRIVADPPVIVPIEEIAGDQVHMLDEFLHGVIRSYRSTLARRPPQAPRALPLYPRRPEGRRRRQRRHARVHLPADGTRQRGSAVPPVQGGAAVGARAVPRQERVRERRRARRRGPASDPGGERHHARLDPDDRRRRRRARLLRPPALGREGLGRGRGDEPRGDEGVRDHLRCGARALPRTRRRPRSRSRLISGRATRSTARSPCSPSGTRTRTSATSRRSRPRSRRGG